MNWQSRAVCACSWVFVACTMAPMIFSSMNCGASPYRQACRSASRKFETRMVILACFSKCWRSMSVSSIFFPVCGSQDRLMCGRLSGSIESLLSADMYGRIDGLFIDALNSVPVFIALCDVGVMSRFLNSAHQVSTNWRTASVVVSDTKSVLGVNCSERR